MLILSSLQVATASSEPSVPAMLTNKSILNVKPETGGSPEMLFAEATPVNGCLFQSVMHANE